MKKHVKKLLLVILIIAMITVPLVGCVDKTTTEPENVSSLKAGTYTGVGKGKNGDVKVEVTFDDSKITEIKVVEHQETEGIAETPIERIPEEIINNQNVAIDGVSGATMTSDAIIEAVKDCIVQANGNVDDFTKVVEKPTDAEEEVYDTQLAVVGAGASGLMAAMYASEQGVDVIVLEKAATIGSSNGAVAGGPATSSNRVQEAENESVSSDELFEYMYDYSQGTVNSLLLRKSINASGQVVDKLLDMGLEATLRP